MRQISPSEIQTRIQSVYNGKNGVPFKAVLLLYKDSRYDMAVLDELYTPYGWQTSYESINGVLYCTISVYDAGKGQWISKTSNGIPSKQEKEKGEASDALKRAGFLWGIGRELYTAPQIEISLSADDCYVGKDGGYKLSSKFMVSKIEYDEKNFINLLEIVDQKGNKRFSWTSKNGAMPFSQIPKGTAKLDKPVEKVERKESNGYFKPMAVFDSAKVFGEFVGWIGMDRTKTLFANMGFTSSQDVKRMTEDQYHEAIKIADKMMAEVVAEEANA